jgi:hypothetical protein
MSQPNRRAVQGRRGLALAVALLVWAGGAGAQAPFAVEDVLDMRNVSIADVSDDGRYVVVTYASLRDRIGIDNHRFGDPTYVAPGVADVVLIDTRTGESRPLFRERRQVRGAEFSPDGSTVAMLLREGDQFTLATIDVASGRVRTARPPAGRLLAENSPLQWTADGTRLLVSLRTTEWARAAAERFQQEVKGPIVVQSSDDPFLSWEAIRRLSSLQIPALFNIADRRFHEIGDESVLASFALTGDGERLRYEPDITKKTSYEEIFGRESALAVRPVGGGEETTLFESTKGMRFLWSRDGTRFVYGKEGAIFAGSLEGGDPRRIAGPDSARRDSTAAPAAEPPDSAARAAERERRRSERFTPVRLSDDGRTVIASNSEGLWFIDTESGERQRFVDSPAEDPEADGAAAGPRPPRWSVVGWSRDGGTVWLSEDSRETWDRAADRVHRLRGVLRRRFNARSRCSTPTATRSCSRPSGSRPAIPGEAWLKGVTAAANHLIEHGHRRPRPARRARHQLRRLRHQPADHADEPLQGRHQHQRQGGHDQLLHGLAALGVRNIHAPERARTASAPRCGSSRRSTSPTRPSCSPTASARRCCS